MHVVNVMLPNADGIKAITPTEVRALVHLIQRTAAPPGTTREVSLDMIATALGISRGTLWAWMRDAPRKPGKVSNARGIPFTAFYCLQVLATNPAAARADVFEPMWARIAPPILPRKARVPGSP